MLLPSIDLAVAAGQLGADGAFYRVHHFARQLASPFPLLAAAAKTTRIALGTGVIDMRYGNPLHMAEDAGAADLISGGRLQLGLSRGSPPHRPQPARRRHLRACDRNDPDPCRTRHRLALTSPPPPAGANPTWLAVTPLCWR